jgi:hypothetical protein
MEPTPHDSASPAAESFCAAPQACDPPASLASSTGDIIIALGFIVVMLVVLAFSDKVKRILTRYIK